MLKKGLYYTSSATVTAEKTAIAMGSGDMEVLATPALVALLENAAMEAVIEELDDDQTTVGARIDVMHTHSHPDRHRRTQADLCPESRRQRRRHRAGHPRALHRQPLTLPRQTEKVRTTYASPGKVMVALPGEARFLTSPTGLTSPFLHFPHTIGKKRPAPGAVFRRLPQFPEGTKASYVPSSKNTRISLIFRIGLSMMFTFATRCPCPPPAPPPAA